MPWAQSPSSTIELKDGRVLITLRNAANLFGGFSDSIIVHGRVSYALVLLIEAAEDRRASAIEAATVQLQRALFRAGKSSLILTN
jgi:hypothetical protein